MDSFSPDRSRCDLNTELQLSLTSQCCFCYKNLAIIGRSKVFSDSKQIISIYLFTSLSLKGSDFRRMNIYFFGRFTDCRN